MKKVAPFISTSFFFLIFFVVHAGAITPVESDFNDPPDLDGWSCVAGSCTNPGQGGASTGDVGDGFLRYEDYLGSVQGDVLAPVEYLGDYSTAENLFLEYDVKVFNPGQTGEYQVPGVALFSGSATNYLGTEHATYGPGIFVTGPTDWIHVQVPLDFSAEGWNVRADFDPSSVTFFRFAGDMVEGIEIIGYDNVVIAEPCVYCGVANAEASSYGSNSLIASGVTNELTLILIPIGAVIFLQVLRRKR